MVTYQLLNVNIQTECDAGTGRTTETNPTASY